MYVIHYIIKHYITLQAMKQYSAQILPYTWLIAHW